MSSDDLGATGDSGSSEEPWAESDDAFTDLSGMDMFTQEIENVDASDWDVDSESLWGDETADTGADIGDVPPDGDFLV
jgi:hypothetical protein